MKTLANIEHRFQAFVLNGDTSIAQEFDGADAHTLKVRMAIYYDAYRSRLVEVLGQDFEVTRVCLGADAFDTLARSFVEANASAFRNVRWYGNGFSEHIAAQPEFPDQTVAAELARFEWTIGRAFDAEDAPILGFDELAGIAPDQWADIRFTTHPSLHVLEFCTNALELWSTFQDHSVRGESAMHHHPLGYAIWRFEETPHYRLLESDEAWAIEAIRSDATFGELCEGLCAYVHDDEAPMRAATLIQAWVHAHWLSGVKR